MAVDALLADPSIEIVLNLTPPTAHVGVSRAAIAAGKHVYSEKPFATTRADAAAILADGVAAGVRRRGRPGHVPRRRAADGPRAHRRGRDRRADRGECRGHAPGTRTLAPQPGLLLRPRRRPAARRRSVLHRGAGQPARPDRGGVGRGARHRRASGGSAPGHAPARPSSPRSRPTPSPSTGSTSGAIGGFTASFDVAASASPHIEIHGTDGSLSLGDPNHFDGAVRLRHLGDDDWMDVPLRFDGSVGRGIGLADMIAAIREGRSPRASGALAFHALDVLLATETGRGDARRAW